MVELGLEPKGIWFFLSHGTRPDVCICGPSNSVHKEPIFQVGSLRFKEARPQSQEARIWTQVDLTPYPHPTHLTEAHCH